MAHTLNFKII